MKKNFHIIIYTVKYLNEPYSSSSSLQILYNKNMLIPSLYAFQFRIIIN